MVLALEINHRPRSEALYLKARAALFHHHHSLFSTSPSTHLSRAYNSKRAENVNGNSRYEGDSMRISIIIMVIVGGGESVA